MLWYLLQRTAWKLAHCWGASLVSRTDYSRPHGLVECSARKTGRCSDSKKVSYWAVKKATLMVRPKDVLWWGLLMAVRMDRLMVVLKGKCLA